MTENIPQTSASERYAAARKVLAQYGDKSAGPEDGGAVAQLTLALRALIAEVPATIEDAAVSTFADERTARGTLDMLGPMHSDHYAAAFRLGFREGIQSAHERWEPADVPSQEQMLRWLGIEARPVYAEGELVRLEIPTQHIEREEG